VSKRGFLELFREFSKAFVSIFFVTNEPLGSSEIWSAQLKVLYNRHTESRRGRR